MIQLLLGSRENATLRVVYEFLAAQPAVPTVWLDASALVDGLCIDDSITGEGIDIHWRVDGFAITPATTSGVLNLLGAIDPSAMRHFAAEDADYVRAEFTAYLQFALNYFPNVINPAWGGSVSGFCQSLPYQWHLVSRQFPHLRIPRFYFGHLTHAPHDLAFGYNTVVSDNVYDGRFWLSSDALSYPQDEPYLVYCRPVGNPLVVVVLDNNMWVQSLESDVKPAVASHAVRDVAMFLMAHFHLRLAELLFFSDPATNSIVFGSIQPEASIEHVPHTARDNFLNALSLTLDGSHRVAHGRGSIMNVSTGDAVPVPGPVARKYRSVITAELRPQVLGASVESKVPPSHLRGRRGRPKVLPAILVIASEDDRTAAYFHAFAVDRGFASEMLYAEDIESMSALVALLARSPHTRERCGIYLRLPGSRDSRLSRVMSLMADVLSGYGGPVVGRPSRLPLNYSKPLQTAVMGSLAALDVRAVPTYVITLSDEFGAIDQRAVVIKSMSAVRSEVVTLVDARLSREAHLARCPIQMQRRLYGVNVRVHVCGGRVVPVGIESASVDYRYDPGFTVEPILLPTPVEQWCTTAATREGLEFAGIDLFHETAADQYYCFEVNPSPGYHTYERELVKQGTRPIISEWLLGRLTTFSASPAADH